MTLDNLLRIGKLKPHATSKVEITRLLAAAERALGDANVASLSAISRLDLAYKAIMQTAMVAMLANGYRPATSEPGHHQLLIQALPKTAGIAIERVRVLDAYRAARNLADCEGVAVSDAVAHECAAEAAIVVQQVRMWVAANRPELCWIANRALCAFRQYVYKKAISYACRSESNKQMGKVPGTTISIKDS